MLANGTLIDDRFEIQSTIGVGGFGAVYKAKQLQFDRIVALKMLATNVLQQDDGAARFEREAQAINALKHRNIVSFYGYGVWNQAPYMVVEFVDGISVQAEIEQCGKIEPRRALMLIRQVFEALSSAHAAGVIHRDLKPSNVMLSQAHGSEIESVKVIDFGLAKLMPGYGIPGQKLTETGYALGSCHFMPPEQALGITVDPRADIYSAGCVFYFMLTGQLPFDADNNIAVMMQHLNETPEPVSKAILNHPLSMALSSFIDNCMAKEREDRYGDCHQALTHIDAMLRGDTKFVQPNVSRSPQHKRFLDPKALRVSLLIVAFALLLAFALVIRTPPRPTAREILSAEVGKPQLGRTGDVPLGVWEKIYAANSSDHSLTAKEELAVLVNLANERAVRAERCKDEILAERIFQLIPSNATSEYDLIRCGLVLRDLGYRERAISVFKGILVASKDGTLPESYDRDWAVERLMDIYADGSEWTKIISLGRQIPNPSRMMRYWISVAQLLSDHIEDASNTLPEEVVLRVTERRWDDVEVRVQRARIYLAQRQPRRGLETLKGIASLDASCNVPQLDFNLLRLAAQAVERDPTSARESYDQIWSRYISDERCKALVSYDIALCAEYLKLSPDSELRQLARQLSELESYRNEP